MSGEETQRDARPELAGKPGKGGMNLQDSFLNQVRKDGNEVKVSLVDGTMIRGCVRGFDNFTLVLHVGGLQHLVYKHAIAQIVARRPGAKPQAPPPAKPEEQTAPEPPTEAAPTTPRAQPFNGMDFSTTRPKSESPVGAEAPAATD